MFVCLFWIYHFWLKNFTYFFIPFLPILYFWFGFSYFVDFGWLYFFLYVFYFIFFIIFLIFLLLFLFLSHFLKIYYVSNPSSEWFYNVSLSLFCIENSLTTHYFKQIFTARKRHLDKSNPSRKRHNERRRRLVHLRIQSSTRNGRISSLATIRTIRCSSKC